MAPITQIDAEIETLKMTKRYVSSTGGTTAGVISVIVVIVVVSVVLSLAGPRKKKTIRPNIVTTNAAVTTTNIGVQNSSTTAPAPSRTPSVDVRPPPPAYTKRDPRGCFGGGLSNLGYHRGSNTVFGGVWLTSDSGSCPDYDGGGDGGSSPGSGGDGGGGGGDGGGGGGDGGGGDGGGS